MKIVLLLAFVIGTAVAFDFPEAWEQWKKDQGKVGAGIYHCHSTPPAVYVRTCHAGHHDGFVCVCVCACVRACVRACV